MAKKKKKKNWSLKCIASLHIALLHIVTASVNSETVDKFELNTFGLIVTYKMVRGPNMSCV